MNTNANNFFSMKRNKIVLIVYVFVFSKHIYTEQIKNLKSCQKKKRKNGS